MPRLADVLRGTAKIPPVLSLGNGIPHSAVEDQTEFLQCLWAYTVFLSFSSVWRERQLLSQPTGALGALAASRAESRDQPGPVCSSGQSPPPKLVLFTITLPRSSYLCWSGL